MRTILCRRGKGEEALARMRELIGKLKLTVNRCHSLGGRPRSGRRSCQQRRALAHSHRSAGSCGSIEPTRFSRRHPLEPRRGNRSLLRGTSRWSTRSLPRATHECNELNVACCAGFRTECRTCRRARAAGVRKAPRHEIAVCGALAVPRALWGIERDVGLKENDAKRSSPWLRSKAWVSLQG